MKKEIIFVEASVTGAGVRAFEFAREGGLWVTLVTRNPDNYAPELLAQADEVITCDTNSAEEVSRVARSRASEHAVVAVTTTADMHVPQAAFAAHALSLPGL